MPNSPKCIVKHLYHNGSISERERDKLLKALEQEPRWIPCNERLPKENEYVGDVCKYYLIQDEYGDMHVSHFSNVGWIPMDSLKAIGNEIIAWQELPQPYAESEVQDEDSD